MVLLYFLIISGFVSTSRVALAQEPASHTSSEPMSDGNDSRVLETSNIDERMFVESFVSRRKEHLIIVTNIRKMRSYDQQYKIISMLADNASTIVESSRAIIESTKFVAGDSVPLKNITLRAALSTILENSALLGDVILQLPDIAHRVMKSQKNCNKTIHWCLDFVNETKHLLDEPTRHMFNLVRQELNIIPRDANYSNPFRSDHSAKLTNDRMKKNSKKDSQSQKRKKGPRMVNIEL